MEVENLAFNPGWGIEWVVQVVLSRARERARPFVERLAREFAGAGFTPNALTLLGLFTGVVASIFFAFGEEQLAGIFLLACGFFDLMDGAVARVRGMVTGFGGVLDSVMDRYVDFFVMFGIIYGGLAEAFGLSSLIWGGAALVGSFMVSYVRARGEAAGVPRLDVGIAERGERILLLSFGALVGWTNYAVVLVAVLTHLTVIQRVVVVFRAIS